MNANTLSKDKGCMRFSKDILIISLGSIGKSLMSRSPTEVHVTNPRKEKSIPAWESTKTPQTILLNTQTVPVARGHIIPLKEKDSVFKVCEIPVNFSFMRASSLSEVPQLFQKCDF